MARRRYPKYRSRYSSYGRRAAQRRNKRIMVLGIIVIVAVVVLIRQFSGDEAGNEAAQSPIQGIDITPGLTSETVVVSTADSGTNTSGPSSNPTISTPEVVDVPEEPVKPQVQEPDEPERPAVVQTSEVQTAGGTATEAAATKLMASAATDIRAGNIIQARKKLNQTLDLQLSPSDYNKVKEVLGQLAEEWLFGPKVLPGDDLTEYYMVQSGDNFSAIANRYKVPYDVLMRINGISDPRRLRAGQKIKVVNGPFNVAIYKSSFTMDLYLQRTYVKSYKVGLGAPQYETPSGKWRVRPNDKLIRPNWTDPDSGRTYLASDPDYPLGERWIGIEGVDEKTRSRNGFAIHGTKEPESIGKRASRGCIRLKNSDVVELYGMLTTTDSQVHIFD